MINMKNNENQPVGRPIKDTEKRKYRNLTLSDEVFNGLKKLGNGSASQAVADLYREKMKSYSHPT